MDARNALSQALLGLTQQGNVKHFFAELLVRQRLVLLEEGHDMHKRVETMAVDGASLFIHPSFLLSLTPKSRTQVLAHEAAHVALGHTLPYLWQHVPQYNNAAQWARRTACELTANLAAGITEGVQFLDGRVEQGVTVSSVKELTKLPLPDRATTKEYYELLLPWAEKNAKKLPTMPMDFIIGTGNPGESPLPSGSAPLEVASLMDKLRNAARAAAVSNNAGSDHGTLSEVFALMNKEAETIKWETHLRRAIARTLASDSVSTPFRINRRMPFVYQGQRKLPKLEVDVVVDTSGSMAQDMLNRAILEVEAIAKVVGGKVRLIGCDTKAHVSYAKKASDIKLIGGGGTNLTPGLEATKAKCVVIITDGGHYGPPLKRPKGAEVIFVITGGAEKCDGADFGKVIKAV